LETGDIVVTLDVSSYAIGH